MSHEANDRRPVIASSVLGATIGLLQGILETALRMGPARKLILTPGDIFDLSLPRTIRKLFLHPESDSIPAILDVYLGPDLLTRLPVVAKIIGIYLVAGAVAGLTIGVMGVLVRRLGRPGSRWTQAFPFSIASLLCLVAVSNLLASLSRAGFFDSAGPSGLMLAAGVAVGALIFWLNVYRLVERLRPKPWWPKILGFSAAFTVAALTVATGSLLWQLLTETSSTSEYRAISGNPSGWQSRPNILLISIDSLRADHLGAYGYDRPTSPNIDRLAAEGVLFSQATSTTSWTLPAHVSLLTGLYPQAHQVLRARERLADTVPTLAELMSQMGYTTAAFVSAPFLNSSYGMDRGFDVYDDYTIDYQDHAESHTGSTSGRIHAAIENWLRRRAETPFLLFAHYWDVHYDYTPPPPYDRKFDPDYEGTLTSRGFESNPRISAQMDPRDLTHLEALYDGEIAYTDLFIGKLLALLEELELTDETLIVLTSDHGDEFFEHGGKGHFRTLFEEVLRVPLVVRFPDGRYASRRVDEVVSLVDVVPTLLDYIGSGAVPPMQGRSLMPLISGDTNSAPSTYASLKAGRAALRTNDTKLIYSFNKGIAQFYDLVEDPAEQNDLAREEGGLDSPAAKEAIAALVSWLNSQRRYLRSLPRAPSEANRAIDQNLEQELRALGYLD